MARNYLNEADIIARLPHDYGLSQTEKKQLLTDIFNTIDTQISHGQAIHIRNFGTFSAKQHGKQRRYDPNQQKLVDFPPYKTVKFSAAQALKNHVSH